MDKNKTHKKLLQQYSMRFIEDVLYSHLESTVV